MRVLIVWLINAVSLILVTNLVPGIHVDGLVTALVVALALGLINTFLRPVLLILTLPVSILTLGLFIFVINGFCFALAAHLVRGFYVHGFLAAMMGALAYSFVSWLASLMLVGRNSRRD